MSKNPLEPLIETLSKLPSIGPKSAQRLAFFLLSLPEEEVCTMATTMITTRQSIKYCTTCFNISVSEICYICLDLKRVMTQLCVVAEPKDVFAIERTHEFKGVYHVLGGLISPLDGTYPESLRIQELIERLKKDTYSEIILAINPTIEGESTILYLQSILQPYHVKISTLAYGLPVGSDMDYADELTLQKALVGRH
jgi:recombination protein RecR